MLNLLLTLFTLWLMAGLAFVCHALMHRYGVVLLLTVTAVMTVLLQLDFGIVYDLMPGVEVRVMVTAIVPVMIAIVMTVYIADGADMTRIIVVNWFGMSLLAMLFGLINSLQLQIATGQASSSAFGSLGPAIVASSLVAYSTDFLFCTVGYQWVRNRASNIPRSMVIAIFFLLTVMIDSTVFLLLYDGNNPAFLNVLLGDLIGKLASALALLPLLLMYLARIAPRLPNYIGDSGRSTFDAFNASFSEVRVRLLATERALAHAERSLQQEAAYIREVSQAVDVAFWLADPRINQPLYINPAYERIWGRDTHYFIAHPQAFIETVVQADRSRMPDFARIAREGRVETDFRIHNSKGEIRHVRERAFALYDETGEAYRVGGVAEDMTEHQIAQTQRRELKFEREKLRVLRTVLENATHDLKVPLSSINLKMHGLSRLQEPARQREALAELESIIANMSSLIDDVLMLARLENTREMELHPCDLREIVRRVETMICPLAARRSLDLSVRVPDTPAFARIDRDDMTRALSNLVDNAVRYTPPGGTVTLALEPSPSVPSGDPASWHLIVRDTGIGIPPDQIGQVFDRFYRADNGRAFTPGGTGLGLAIVQQVAHQHGGKVSVESTPGQGSVFTLVLPQSTPSEASPS